MRTIKTVKGIKQIHLLSISVENILIVKWDRPIYVFSLSKHSYKWRSMLIYIYFNFFPHNKVLLNVWLFEITMMSTNSNPVSVKKKPKKKKYVTRKPRRMCYQHRDISFSYFLRITKLRVLNSCYNYKRHAFLKFKLLRVVTSFTQSCKDIYFF